jgi:hypothetical protein
MADEFENLEEEFGDFGFGFEEATPNGEAAYEGDPNIQPKLEAPREDVSKRSWDTLGFAWEPLMQAVTNVKLQAMPLPAGFSEGFDSSSNGGGKSVAVKDDPKRATSAIISGLKPETEYVVRIVAKNPAGVTDGPLTAAIPTTRFSPPRGDKSAWLMLLPDYSKENAIKTIGRKMSLKRKAPPMRWFVLDGALLSWYKNVDDEKEDGFCHLGKLRQISFPQKEENTQFSLHLDDKDDTKIDIVCVSERPDVSAIEMFNDWVKTLTEVRRSVGGAATQVVRKVLTGGAEKK